MKVFLQKLFISIAFVTFSYLITLVSPSSIEKVTDFLKLGLTVSVESGKLNSYEMLPVYTVWALLGVFAYLLYLALSNVYYEIYNSIVIKVGYKKPDEKVEIPKMVTLKRIGIHSLVIVVFLTMILILSGMVPISNLIRVALEKSIIPYFPADYAFGLSFLPLIPIWYLIVSAILYLYEKTRFLLFGEKLEEEHMVA